METTRHPNFSAWKQSWKKNLHDKSFLTATFFSLVLLIGSFIADSFANTYATLQAGLPVGDAILGHLHTMNVFIYYAYGPILMIVVFFGALILWPQEIPFAFKSLGLFFLVRSMSVCLTHLGFPPGIYIAQNAPQFFKHFYLGGDLFFSGHAGIPLMAALIFWNHRNLRIFFVLCSVFLGFVVLAGHYHYSIDVFAALFMTPTIFAMAREFFPRDYLRSRKNSPA